MNRIHAATWGLFLAVAMPASGQDLQPRPAAGPQHIEVEWKRAASVEQAGYNTNAVKTPPVSMLPEARVVSTTTRESAPTPVASSPGPAESCPAPVAASPCCEPCGPAGRFWIEGEYLLWWVKGASSLPLATLSPAGTPIENAGVLGTPGATTAFGNQSLNNGVQLGFQIRTGMWLDDCHKCGIEGGFFMLGGDGNNFIGGSRDGSTIVSRPFIDANTGGPNAQLVSFPGVLAGAVAIDSQIPQIWGYDVLMRKQLCCTTDCNDPCSKFNNYRRWDLLVGYRHYDFSDRIDITETLFPLGPNFVPGTTLVVQDSFRARTRFDGLVLGLSGQRARDRWFAQGTIKLNVGQVTREVSIQGQTSVFVPGDVTQVGTGGLLALPSNIGWYRDSNWTVLPEAEVRVGYRITPRLTAYAGYNVMIWPKVARAVEQIDPVVNTNQLPPPLDPVTGPQRPAFTGNTSTLWMQGISLGLNLRF